MRLATKNSVLGIGLFLPALAFFLVLLAYPLAAAILLSFNNVDTLTLSSRYVGLANYWGRLADPEFLSALVNIFHLRCRHVDAAGGDWCGDRATSAPRILFSITGAGLFCSRTCSPPLSPCFVWRWLFNDLYGFLNFALLGLGVVDKPVDWLGRMPNAFVSVIFVSTWKFFPFVVIAVLARLQSIPDYLYEAAIMDGASKWALFWDVTLPQLRSVLSVVILLRVIWDFKEFDMIYLLTGGGPGHGTETLPLMLYKLAFPLSQMGKASAIGVFMLVIMLLVIVPYFRFTDVGGEERTR